MNNLLTEELECLTKEAYCRSFIESTYDEYNQLLLTEEVDNLINEAVGDTVGPPPGTLASEGLLIKVVNALKKIIMMTVDYVKEIINKIGVYFTGLKVDKIAEKVKKISSEDKNFANMKITIPDYTVGVKRYDGLFGKAEGLFNKAVKSNGGLADGDISVLDQIKSETDNIEMVSGKYSKVITVAVAAATLLAIYAILKDVPSQLAEKAQEMHRLALAGNPQPIVDVTSAMASIKRSESRYLHNIIKKIYDELRYIVTGYADIARPKGMTPSKFLHNNRSYYPHVRGGKIFESVILAQPLDTDNNVFDEAFNSIMNSME